MSEAFDVHATGLEPGVLLLEASAGTGKTWSLTSIAVRLLLEGRVASVDRLLLVTYTRAATDELRRRLRDRLHETEMVLRGGLAEDPFLIGVLERWAHDRQALERVTRARRDVDQARVRTIHGFCQDILNMGAFEAGLPLDGAEHVDGDRLLRTAWRDTIRDLAVGSGPGLSAALLAFGIDPDGGSAYRTLLTARRHPRERWFPDVVGLEQALATFMHRVESIDFGLIRDFVELTVEQGEWLKGSEDDRAALESIARGLDATRPARLMALFRLDPDRLAKKLKVAGKKRLSGSALERMLRPLGEAIATLEASLLRELCDRALARYEWLKESQALIDHDDVIARTRLRLQDERTGPALARRVAADFDAALVDEFQDTDADQWEIFRTIFATPRHLLLLVGDPKQAIYRFRGADIFAYLQARSAADRRATLTHNWRSTPALVDAVNSIFGHAPDQSFALAEIEFEPVEAGRSSASTEPCPLDIVWIDVPDKRQNAGHGEGPALRQLGADIIRRREELDAAAPDRDGPAPRLAVLVRTHRQARAVMRALREVGVDVVLARGGDIHDSETMGEWRIVLRSLLDPANLRLQRRARATRLWGARLSDLGARSEAFGEIELLAALHRLWRERGVAVMAAELIARRHTVRRWLGEVEGERLVTDLRHGLELLNRAESELGLGPEALVRWAEAAARSEDPESEERPLRLDRESDAVQVLTNFTSKGLQFDTVYLPYAWMDRDLPGAAPFELHDPVTGEPRLDFSGDPGMESQATLEELASRLRMHYVELTRAMERCVLYLAPIKRYFPRTAAAFLLAREEGDAPRERGPWVRRALDGLADDVGRAGERAREFADRTRSIRFRKVEAAAARAANWPAPRLAAPVALDFPPDRRDALRPRFQLSYTALVRSLREQGAAFELETELPLADRADPADAATRGPGEGIFGFARGARAGVCLHELLEHADFTAEVDEAERERIVRLMGRHGLLSPEAHPMPIDPVQVGVDLIERIREERMPFARRAFDQLSRTARLDEWEFRLPVHGLVPRDLAALLREHWGGEEWIAAAAGRLHQLPLQRLEGMLGGFVDLLFVEEGRWTVLDWKSNDLGSSVDDYTPATMRRAMVDHDYLVQVLFYTVAVQRYLSHRIADYDYDRHLAGVSYVFLRGLCGDPERGWCDLRPPRALIDAVDARLGGGA